MAAQVGADEFHAAKLVVVVARLEELAGYRAALEGLLSADGLLRNRKTGYMDDGEARIANLRGLP
jgi:hypothetical protein